MSRKLRQQRRRRRRFLARLGWVTGLGLLLVAAGFWLASSGKSGQGNPELVEVQGRPAIRVDRQVIDFGDVKLENPKSFEVVVTNVGDQPLRLAREPYIEILEGC